MPELKEKAVQAKCLALARPLISAVKLFLKKIFQAPHCRANAKKVIYQFQVDYSSCSNVVDVTIWTS